MMAASLLLMKNAYTKTMKPNSENPYNQKYKNMRNRLLLANTFTQSIIEVMSAIMDDTAM